MNQDVQRVEELLARFRCLQEHRSNVENVWQQIADYFIPHSADITQTRAAGDNSKATKLFDDVGVKAAEYLASELHSGLTNPSIKWLDLAMEEKAVSSPETDLFLQLTRDRLLNIFNCSDSGFPLNNHEFLMSIVTYGTAAMFIELDPDEGNEIKFSALHMSEVFVAEDKYGGIDTVMRKFKLTARQMVQRWGLDKLAKPIQDQYKAKIPNKDARYDILHIVMPRSDTDHLNNKQFKFISYHIDIENKKILSVGGYYENPYIIARLSKLAGEIYGRSPAWQTMPSVKLLNRMVETILKAAQLQAMPPLLIADDGVLLGTKAVPNARIVGGLSLDGVARMQPLNIGGNLNVGIEMIKEYRKSVRDAFFVDQLVFRDGPTMTATEVVQRQQEALKLLAPHIGRLQTEYLTPLIQKVVSIKARAGDLGKVPDELKKYKYEVDYVAPIALLQKASEVQKFQQFMAFAAPLAQIKPEVLDQIDFDLAIQKIAEDLGIWKDIQRDPNQIAQERQARAQQQQAAMAMQAGNTMGDLGVKLSEIKKNQGTIV